MSLVFLEWLSNEEKINSAHYPERATAINSCNGVFTSRFIFRYAFPAKITVSDDVYFESKLLLPV